jgi:hypothetical protein
MRSDRLSDRGDRPLDLKPNAITGNGCLLGYRIVDSKGFTLGAHCDGRLHEMLNMIGRLDFWYMMRRALDHGDMPDDISFDEIHKAFAWLEKENREPAPTPEHP